VKLKNYCFSFTNYNHTAEIIKTCNDKNIKPVLFINNKLISDLGIEWLNSLDVMLNTQKKLKNYKLYVDVKKNYGLFISLVEKGIDYIKIETSKENISKIKEIAKLNKVLINPRFSVVDPLKSKI
tara:strand:+ start:1248 stop:1622 length:375 start_codon:yes stop_codon:yes gene_type:complete